MYISLMATGSCRHCIFITKLMSKIEELKWLQNNLSICDKEAYILCDCTLNSQILVILFIANLTISRNNFYNRFLFTTLGLHSANLPTCFDTNVQFSIVCQLIIMIYIRCTTTWSVKWVRGCHLQSTVTGQTLVV